MPAIMAGRDLRAPACGHCCGRNARVLSSSVGMCCWCRTGQGSGPPAAARMPRRPWVPCRRVRPGNNFAGLSSASAGRRIGATFTGGAVRQGGRSVNRSPHHTPRARRITKALRPSARLAPPESACMRSKNAARLSWPEGRSVAVGPAQDHAQVGVGDGRAGARKKERPQWRCVELTNRPRQHSGGRGALPPAPRRRPRSAAGRTPPRRVLCTSELMKPSQLAHLGARARRAVAQQIQLGRLFGQVFEDGGVLRQGPIAFGQARALRQRMILRNAGSLSASRDSAAVS